jgi:hypothetical protein
MHSWSRCWFVLATKAALVTGTTAAGTAGAEAAAPAVMKTLEGTSHASVLSLLLSPMVRFQLLQLRNAVLHYSQFTCVPACCAVDNRWNRR